MNWILIYFTAFFSEIPKITDDDETKNDRRINVQRLNALREQHFTVLEAFAGVFKTTGLHGPEDITIYTDFNRVLNDFITCAHHPFEVAVGIV